MSEIDTLRQALADAYLFISQPKRMTPTELTYGTTYYNRLTAKMREALESSEGAK